MIYSKEETSNFTEQVFAHLEVTENDHVLDIVLNRPEKKNAMNPVMVNEIFHIAKQLGIQVKPSRGYRGQIVGAVVGCPACKQDDAFYLSFIGNAS